MMNEEDVLIKIKEILDSCQYSTDQFAICKIRKIVNDFLEEKNNDRH